MSVPIDPVASGNPPQSTDAPGRVGDRKARRAQSERRKRRPKLRRFGIASIASAIFQLYRTRDRTDYSRWRMSLLYSSIRMVCSTLRWEVQGREHLDKILAGGHQPIFTFWHVCILSATWFWRNRGIVVMSSVSRDAEYTGRVIKRFGYGTARGSATRGGGRALAEMAHCLENGMEVAFTIDGPRGPAYVAKPGAVTLARHTGQAILPFHIARVPTSRSRAGTACRYLCRSLVQPLFIGEPIYVPRDATSEEIAAKQVTSSRHSTVWSRTLKRGGDKQDSTTTLRLPSAPYRNLRLSDP